METNKLVEERIRIGQLIMDRRNQLKMTQTEVAEKVGMLKQNIHFIEKGKKNVGIDNINKVLSVLNLELNVTVLQKNNLK